MSSQSTDDNNNVDESSLDIAAIRGRIESLLATSGVTPAGRWRIRSATTAAGPPAEASARLPSSSSSDSGPDTPSKSKESSSSEHGSKAFVRRVDLIKAEKMSGTSPEIHVIPFLSLHGSAPFENSSFFSQDKASITVAESEELPPATIHLQLLSPVPIGSVPRSIMNPAETKWRYEPTPSPRAGVVKPSRRSAKEKSWHSADDISVETSAKYLSVDSDFQRSGDSIPTHRRANSGSVTIPLNILSAGLRSISSFFSSSSSIHSIASETHYLDFAVESDHEDYNQCKSVGRVNILRRSPDLSEWNERYLLRCLNAMQNPDTLSQAEIESLMEAGALLPIDRLLSNRPELESEPLSPMKETATVTRDSETNYEKSTTLKAISSPVDDKIIKILNNKFVDVNVNDKFTTKHISDCNQQNGVNNHRETYSSEPILNTATYNKHFDSRKIWYCNENTPTHRKVRSDSGILRPSPPSYDALAAARRFGRQSCRLVRSSGTQTEANDLWQTAHKPRHCVISSVAPKTNPTWARNSAPISIMRREQEMLKQQQQQQKKEKNQWKEQQRVQNKIQQRKKLYRQQQQQLWHQQLQHQQQSRFQKIQRRRRDEEQSLLQQQTQLRKQKAQQRLKEQQINQEPKKQQSHPFDLYHFRPVVCLYDEEEDTDTFIRFIDKQGREIVMLCLISEDKNPRQWRQFVAQQRTPALSDTVSCNRINADAKMQIIHNTVDMNNNEQSQRPVIKSLSRPNGYNSKSYPKTANGSAPPPIMTVSGSNCCAQCDAPLGRGAAMIVEALNLFYHLSCFRCNVCNIALGNGTRGADVQVHGHRLYCQKCFCND